MPLARGLYRSRQVLDALLPRIDPADLSRAVALLGPEEARLFHAMERRDQRHALEVARRVMASTEERAVLVAALLHDCGKGPVPVWLRVLNVLAPRLVERLGADSRDGWRGAAYRLRHHADLGAALAAEAGSSPATVRLIRGQPEAAEAWMHDLLHAADDAS